jgi:DNA-binding transcriptional MocR family regulator
MRTLYLERRNAMIRSVRTRLGGAFELDVPRGGISLWARASRDVDLVRTIAAARQRGVHIADGRRYTFDNHDPRALRLVFAPLTLAEIDRTIATLAASVVVRRRR